MGGSTGIAFTVSVAFASLTASTGFVLALLGWESFRGSPFGRMILLLAAILLALAVYHVLLLVTGQESVPVVESVAFTVLLIWIGLMIRQHHRMARARRETG